MPNSHMHVGKMLLHQLLIASIAYVIHKTLTFSPVHWQPYILPQSLQSLCSIGWLRTDKRLKNFTEAFRSLQHTHLCQASRPVKVKTDISVVKSWQSTWRKEVQFWCFTSCCTPNGLPTCSSQFRALYINTFKCLLLCVANNYIENKY